MTGQDALNELGLAETAGKEEMEQAYRRLVRRYPPEFNPERFQKIDEAYRFLTSLPDRVAQLLSPAVEGGVTSADFRLSAVLAPESVDEALVSLSRGARLAALWPAGSAGKRKG